MRVNGRIQLFPLLRVAVMLALGIATGDALFGDVPVVAYIVAMAVAMAGFLFCGRHPLLQGCMLMAAAFCLGSWLVTAYEKHNEVVLSCSPAEYEGIVVSSPAVSGKVLRCDVLVCSGPLTGKKVKASFLRSSEGRYPQLRVGDGFVAFSTFERQTTFRNGSNFDYSRWLAVHDFVAQTLVYDGYWVPRRVGLGGLSRVQRVELRAKIFRERMLARYRYSGLEGQTYAIVAAMTLGDKSGLSSQTKEIYSVTGASHVLALSGLHLGIVYFLLSFFFVRRGWEVFGHVLIVVSLWAYAVMVGMMPSVVRSATMLSVYALFSLTGRDRMSLNTLSLTAIVMLSANPLLLWDIGFQMSFMAVLGILVLFKPVYSLLNVRWLWKHGMVRRLWSLVVVSLVAQTGVAPLVAFYFGRFSCYFLLTNIIVVPSAALLIWLSLAVLASAELPVIQNIAVRLLQTVVGFVDEGLGWIASVPGASIDNIAINRWQLLLVYVVIVCVVVLAHYGLRLYRSAYGLYARE